MSEKWKQKILLIFPFAVLAAGMILTAAFFLHTYRQIAFEHTSACLLYTSDLFSQAGFNLFACFIAHVRLNDVLFPLFA